MTTDAQWTRFVRMWRSVFREAAFCHIAAERAKTGEGCNNDPHRNTWCTCCP